MTDGVLVIEARGLSRAYRRATATRGESIPVLQGIDLQVARGDRVAIQGESGVGKTTLLNVLGGLDSPDGGELLCLGRPVPAAPADRARWRRGAIGFIFQFHGLLVEFTAAENVALAGLIGGWPRRAALEESRRLLAQLGLAERCEHYPDELSAGEQQRVAVARALLTGPSLVLADEPTGNLDPRTGDQVIDRLFEWQERHQFALVVATHSVRLARRCQRVLRLSAGRLEPASADELDPPARAGTQVSR